MKLAYVQTVNKAEQTPMVNPIFIQNKYQQEWPFTNKWEGSKDRSPPVGDTESFTPT